MNEQRKCLVGRDDDYGWAIGLAIALFVIAMIVAIIVYGGALLADSIPSRITFLRLSTMWLTATVNLYP